MSDYIGPTLTPKTERVWEFSLNATSGHQPNHKGQIAFFLQPLNVPISTIRHFRK